MKALRICSVWFWVMGMHGCLFAQELSLQVMDLYTAQPLSGVLVYSTGVRQDTMQTDDHGVVDRIDISQRKSLSFSRQGYEVKSVELSTYRTPVVRIFLKPLEYELEAIVFTANKFRENRDDIPQELSVISAPEIAFRNPQTSAQLLEQEGGIFVQRSQMGGGSPNLRGFEANKVLLVVDGIRMNNAIYRSGHLQNVLTLDASMVDRAEVLYGPGSVMYGSDALGGVMHFYTRNPQLGTANSPLIRKNFAARYGTANQEKAFHVDINVGGEKWAWLGSASLAKFGDVRVGANRLGAFEDLGIRDSMVIRENGQDQIVANPNPLIQTPTGYQQLDLIQKLSYYPSSTLSHTLNIQLSTSSDIPRYDRLNQVRDMRLRYATWNYGPQERLLAAYHFNHTLPTRWYDHLKTTVAYQRIGESRITRVFQSPIRQTREELVHVASVNVDANKSIMGEHELAYGVEWTYNYVQSTAFTTDIVSGIQGGLSTRYPAGGTKVQSLAGYATHRWELSPEWILTDGLRLTDYRLEAHFGPNDFYWIEDAGITQQHMALSGHLGLVYIPSDSWRFAWNSGTGFRAPNLDDVAKVFDSQPGNVVVPNPSLQPEYTYNTEFTTTYQLKPWLRASVTGFFTFYDQAIVVRDFQLGDQDSILYDGVLSNVQANVNTQQAVLGGLTTKLYATLGRWHLNHHLTLMHGMVLDEGVPLDHVPPLFGTSRLGYRTTRWELEGAIQYQGWKRLDQLSPRDISNLEFATAAGWPSWWILQVKASFELSENLTLQSGIDNLLDVHYRAYSSRISAPGRHFYFTIRGQI